MADRLTEIEALGNRVRNGDWQALRQLEGRVRDLEAALVEQNAATGLIPSALAALASPVERGHLSMQIGHRAATVDEIRSAAGGAEGDTE